MNKSNPFDNYRAILNNYNNKLNIISIAILKIKFNLLSILTFNYY